MGASQADLSEAKRALLAKRLQKARETQAEPQAIGRRPEGDAIPLSFAQKRLWFLYQWDPASPAYNVPDAWRVVGRLDVVALRQAINEIVRRHQVLQTIYVTVDEEPVQISHPEPSLALETVDLGALPPAEREAQVRRLVAWEAGRPFDLARDLPVRTTLLCLDETEHVLLLTLHHIATDGWSSSVFLKELAELYEIFCDGQRASLPGLPIQYADFAHWQRHWLQDGALEKQMAFWREQLTGAPAVLELPADRPRPPVRSYKGAVRHFRLPPSLAQAIENLSHQEGATLFMTLLAAFQTLLHHYTGQDDIVVGTPIANRNRVEIESLIGFFVNTLVMRTDLSGNPTFRQLLGRVREVALEAYAHQDLPFEKMVEELRLERNLSHTPLFQVMFVLQNTPAETFSLPGLTLTPMALDRETAKFDLTLFIVNAGQELEGAFEYNTDLFDAATIDRMAGHFQTVLEGIAASPERRLADLPLLTAAERRKVIRDWNNTRTNYPQTRCIHELFEAQVEQTPDNVALVFRDHHLTHRHLNRRANQLAHHLRALGVGPDVLVGICVERSLEMVVGILGILKAGGAYVPLDPEYPPERLAFMLEDTRSPVLLTQEQLIAKLPAHEARLVCLDVDWPAIAQEGEANPASHTTPDNLAYVMYTSGSTGRPKGASIVHRSVVRLVKETNYASLTAEEIFFQLAPISFDASTLEIWGSLLNGARLAILAPGTPSLEELGQALQQHRITTLWLTAGLFHLMVDERLQDLRPVRQLLAGGDVLSAPHVQRVLRELEGCRLINGYGPTENTTFTCCYPMTAGSQVDAPVPIGKPIANTQVYVLDRRLQPAPVGIPGELYIGGAGLARDYLNRPALTSEAFTPHPFGDEPGARLYKTGDVVRYLPDGNVEFMGRNDLQVKVRGFRIELGEIEATLGQHPAVREAVVLARQDTPGDKRLVAYVVPQEGCEPGINDLRRFLKERAPQYMMPSAFVVLETLPLTPNNKVDRRALPAPEDTRPELEAVFVAPRNEVEDRIAAVWAEILGIEQIGIDDNFFDLGGESFKAIRAVRKIGGAIGVMDLFKQPTIRELAVHLAREKPKSAGLLHELSRPVPAGKKVLSLVCVPYAGGSAIIYQSLAGVLPEGYSLYAVELPGHDYSRPDEALQPLAEVARQCAAEIQQEVTGPIALYGYCMGGPLTIEIARLLEEAGVQVTGIFMAAHFPSPRLPGKFFRLIDRVVRAARKSERLEFELVRAFGGFTDIFDPEVQAFVMRSYFHDSREGEDYYTRVFAAREGKKLAAPVLSIVGQMDRATEFYHERFKEWEFFSDAVDLAVIPEAGHFFLKHQPADLVRIITDQVAVWQGRAATAPHITASSRPKREPDVPAGRASVAAKRAVAPSLNVFFLIAFGQLVSLIGTGLTSFALGIWVFQKTGAVSDLAIISVFVLLPSILLSPIAGAVVDRWDRRLIMILSDVAAACATLLVAWLLWTGSLQIWHIYLTSGIRSVANTFQQPAYTAAIAQLVPKRYLGHANGIAQLGIAAGGLLAPLLGGVLVTTIQLHGVVLFDFATFLFAVTTLLLVRFPDALFKRREEPLLKAIVGGWDYVVKRRGLMALIVFFVVINFLFSIMSVLLTPMVLSFGSTTVLGAVMAASGAGLLIGGLIMSLWGGTERRAEGLLRFATLFGLFTLVMGLRPAPIYPIVGLFGIEIAVALVNAHWAALVQTKVGLELQGRVLATGQMLVWSMMPLGYIVAGPLADKVFEPLMLGGGPFADGLGRLIGAGPGRGMGLMMILLGLIGVAWAMLGYRYRPLRFVEDDLPDAIPAAVIIADKDELQKRADHGLLSEAV